jgi:hypothetical protein
MNDLKVLTQYSLSRYNNLEIAHVNNQSMCYGTAILLRKKCLGQD